MLRTEFKAGAVGYRVGKRALPVGRGVCWPARLLEWPMRSISSRRFAPALATR